MSEYRMRVFRYYPDKLYGFCRDEEGNEFFFHLSTFQPGPPGDVTRCSSCAGPPRCHLDDHPPPPILDEPVVVSGELAPQGAKAARAKSVTREKPPRMMLGVVETFDPQRRYGFVKGSDGVDYHLHDSEIIDGRLPLAGSSVVFFPGHREGRPRACHVRVCR